MAQIAVTELSVFSALAGQIVVRQSWPSINSHRTGSQRPATQGRWSAQEPLCENLLPP